MQYFAQLDQNNVVLRVICLGEGQCLCPHTGDLLEDAGVAYCRQLYGLETEWKMTCAHDDYSDSGSRFRKNFADVGFTYDPNMDAFIPPKPHSSWLLDPITCTWQPPIPRPEDTIDTVHIWDETKQEWTAMSVNG